MTDKATTYRNKYKIAICFSLLLFLSLWIGLSCAEKYHVDFKAVFNDLRNSIFPPSITIKLDNEIIVSTRCKDTYTTQIDVTEGIHTLGFYIANDEEYQALNLNITKDTEVQCRVNVDDAWPKIYLDNIQPNSAKIILYRKESEGWHCNKCGQLTDVLFSNCVYCGNKASGNATIFSLHFKENRLFSKYDVNMYIDNILYKRLYHGRDAQLECYLSAGNHTVKIQKHDDSQLFIEKEIYITGNSQINLSFEVNRNSITIYDSNQTPNKTTDHSVYFLRSKGTSTTGFHFNIDKGTFTYYIKTHSSSGKKNSWEEKGIYQIDDDGKITLVYNEGKIEHYKYTTRIKNQYQEEVIIPLNANTTPSDDNTFIRKK